jgi:hypothetical protein
MLIYTFHTCTHLAEYLKLNFHFSTYSIDCMYTLSNPENRIGGVMVSVFASSGVDRGFETIKLVSRWVQV